MRISVPVSLTFFFLILLLGTSAYAQDVVSPQTKPYSSDAKAEELSKAKISFSETLWDFGYVPRTGSVIHTYTIRNDGEDSLIIVKVRTTCACTIAPLSKQRLAPGETAELDIVFITDKVMPGQATKRVRVVSNDPNNPFTELQITAKVGESSSLVRINPASVSFDTVSQGTEVTQAITIENTSGEKLSMARIEGPGDGIEVDIDDIVIEPGKSIQANLTLNDNAVLGNLKTSLTLDFECSKRSRISIPITAFIVEK